MTEARVGRLLPACLHQAIADQLPQRLEFYEHWLRSEGLRDAGMGLAPMTAVVGFLRTEGAGYERVMARAGVLAAQWSIASIAPVRRRLIGWLPRPLRARAALRVALSVVRSMAHWSRVSARMKRGTALVRIESSLFCTVRERHATPLCGFYLATVVESLRQFGVAASGRIEACSATGAAACELAIELSGSSLSDPAISA